MDREKASQFLVSRVKWVGLIGCIAICLAMAPETKAQIVANFADGTNTTTADGYTGAAGSGWTAGWVASTNAPSYITASGSIIATNPLNSGGNYLSYTVTNSAANTASSWGLITRQFDGTATGILVSQPLQYSWTFKASDYSSANYAFINNVGGAASGTGGANTWVVKSIGGLWYYQSGTSVISTGFAATANDVYNFTINSDPTTNSYTFSIQDLTASTSFSLATAASYRNKTGVDGAYLAFGSLANVGTSATFSLDSIAIVPEPSSIAMVAVGFLGISLLRGTRRMRNVNLGKLS